MKAQSFDQPEGQRKKKKQMQGKHYRICRSGIASSALYQTRSVYRCSNTLSKHLKGAGWKVIKDGLIPILVRLPKNSVLLHSGD